VNESKEAGDARRRLGLRPVINAAGTMTYLGSSIAVPEVVACVAEILPCFVEIHDLQRQASARIARSCGAEAGFVTASAAAGITLAVAGCMTGADLAAIERLPDTGGLACDAVVAQAGHLVHYGAPVAQAVRLAGARVVPVGTATLARAYQLEAALGERTAAALYVVSHHVVGHGQIPLEAFAAIVHARGVPVIVDAASEYDLRGFLAAGADIVIHSAHKFLGGPTAGIVAGRKDLVRAAYLQSAGIGRGMKVGKEGIAGTMAALEAWERRDHAAIRACERRHLELWRQGLAGEAGIAVRVVPDPTGNPLDRLEVAIDPELVGMTAWELADALAAGDPPVIVRAHEVEHGFFQLDPCNLHDGEAEIVLGRLRAELAWARAAAPRPRKGRASALAERDRRAAEALLRWPS
jgi:L-seryl-tRNA(Ser) seleniumtransferase